MWCVLSRPLWQERNIRETKGCHIQIYILETAFFSLREFGEQLVSWNCFFAETQEADCWEPKSRAEEISGMCAIINAVAAQQPGEAQREFYTAWLVVVVPAWFFFLFLCRSEMRLYTISGTLPRQLHTPVPKWCGVKGSTPVLSFFVRVLFFTWQFEITSGKTVYPKGSIRYHIIISLCTFGLRWNSNLQIAWEGQALLSPLGHNERWYI